MSSWRRHLIRTWLLFAATAIFAGENGIELSKLLSKSEDEVQSPAIAVEDSVFMLSPGDKLRLQWWGTGSGEATLIVDTKRSLLVPEIGEIDVRNKSFRDVRDTLRSMIEKRFHPRLISLRLLEIQGATVWITGVLPNPGPQQIAPGTRLSRILPLGGILPSELLRASMTAPAPRSEDGVVMPSLRHILVIRNGKDTLVADLARAFRAGTASMDPPLYSGDRIVLVPETRHCGLNSGLAHAGVVECREGDSVRAVLQAAGIQTMPDSVRITDVNGSERIARLDHVIGSDVALLSVSRPPDSERRKIVFIGGRVSQPGAYFYRPGMTIRDLVSISGGVVGGDDSGIIFGIRRGGVAVLPGRRQGLEMLPAVAEVAKAYQAYLGTWRGLYSHGDLPLDPEDSVVVKSAQRVVWVGGRVVRPGFVPWKKNGNWEHYIAEAGGFTPDAWESRTQLINPITEQPGSPEGEILPGSALIVPEERYIPPEQWISISISVVSLISSLVTIFILLDSRQ